MSALSATHLPRTATDTADGGGDIFSQRRLLDVTDMAQLMGTSERMSRRLIAERRVPTVKIGRHVRVWSDDLLAYLEASTRPAVSAR